MVPQPQSHELPCPVESSYPRGPSSAAANRKTKPSTETEMMMKEGKCHYDGEINPRSNAKNYPAIPVRLVEGKTLEITSISDNTNMHFSIRQRVFIVKTYWKTNLLIQTQRAFRAEFAMRNVPTMPTILLMSQVCDDDRGSLVNSPKKSLRRLSQETGYSDGTCQRAAKKSGLRASFFVDCLI
ncbi:hypothetical protein ANN_04110 [Periplaneta americana]|uniref:DUF4817 domain-containing protein n=1 Tax=Periplaneta americana TaxID=6978 RepID=A0ABQ8T8D9_PERAM|nr:hypothetical protein ANN_04110 [Periplaneta americana]